MNIKNKTVFITGASDGLGRAIALEFAKEEVNSVLIGRNKKRLEEVAKKAGKNALVLICDVTKPKEVKNAVDKAVEKFGHIDVVINCAGVWYKMKPIEEASDEDIDDVIDIDLKGVLNVTKYAIPILKKNNESYIVNISSQSGVKAKHLQSVYCAAKFGVKGFTDSLKLELDENNIKVIGFYPSGMNTQMFAKTGEKFDSSNFMKVEDIAEIIKFIVTRPNNICMEEVWVKKF